MFEDQKQDIKSIWKKEFCDTNFAIGKPCWRFDWILQSSSSSFCTWLHNLCNRVQNSMHV